MIPVSVVIITKNEAEVIGDCITAAKMITDDILIIDNYSIDETYSIAVAGGCRVYQRNWDGYGTNKNKGIALAKYDWILSIDADEIADLELALSLHSLKLDDPAMVYDVRFKSYFGKKLIRYGSWGRDHHIRLFNRTRVKWSQSNVHETLVLPDHTKMQRLDGFIHHYSVKNTRECNAKALYYARLSAEKYLSIGKKANTVNLYLSPIFSFIKNYIFFGGFLDGKEGLAIARITYKNKWLKYHYLLRLENNAKKKQYLKPKLAVEY
ncbi:glycosyltransferase family 2 protein [Mucilaginibacter sp. UR6-11]|uniref:glycosyltransferase family 2 protein n=1 Tax=Mucilaginibacter sp. UR6-11 TaxID=1435644 RepID=UPI001E4372BD|nr:glycosyltransferase family 2 protein [Mucilaginibacter sp. UR6-11]MCC8427149.1 glycosyltransferase family 2 protein [Mucilaginibacter sp. UR6-11]